MGALRRSILGLLALAAAALAIAAGAAAGPPSVSTTLPFTYDGTNNCTAEAFTGTGTAHVLISENVSTSGVLERHVQMTIDGLKAVALVTGKRYVVQDIFFEEFVFSSTTDEDTFDMTLHYIRLGEDGALMTGDDFYFYMRAHITAHGLEMPAFHVSTNDMPCQ